MLLLHPNEPVSAERLAIALFGEETAASVARKKVQVHVSRLRKALGEDILTTTPAGYRLRVDPGELDAERFDRLVEHGRSALTAGQRQEAAALLREAEDMWRGPAARGPRGRAVRPRRDRPPRGAAAGRASRHASRPTPPPVAMLT